MQKKACIFSCVGCGGIVLALMIGFGLLVQKVISDIENSFSNPDARAQTLLAEPDAYPPGYGPIAAFGLPFIGDFVFLGEPTGEPGGEGIEKMVKAIAMTDPSLLFFKTPGGGENPDLNAFLKDGQANSFFLMPGNIWFHADEMSSRGFFTQAEGEIIYLSTVGRVVITGDQETTLSGAYTLFSVKCAGGATVVGLWLDQEASVTANEDGTPPAGSAADPQAFRAMMQYFSLCR